MKLQNAQQGGMMFPLESPSDNYWLIYNGTPMNAPRPSSICCQTNGKECSLILPAGETIEEPIHLVHLTTQAIHYKTQVIAEEGSHAKIVESYFQFPSNPVPSHPTQSQIKTQTEIFLKNGAALDHILWVLDFDFLHPPTEVSISTDTQVEQAEQSHYRNFLLSQGHHQHDSNLQLNLRGKQARAEISAAFLPKQTHSSTFSCLIEHLQPQCHSQVSARSVVEAYAKFKFLGKIKVHEGAAQSVARLENKNILLSASAEVETQPELEIYHDDLNCSHGATIGHLDEETLFYLKSRGIPEQQAKEMLVSAFIQPLLHAIPLPDWQFWQSDWRSLHPYLNLKEVLNGYF